MSNITPYFLEVGSNNTSFEFISDGPNGKIVKLVLFSLLQQNDAITIYNLAFGDKNSESGELNDLAVSNNGDTEKVLASVVAAVRLFFYFHANPNLWIFATGSTKARTRLYQMGISKFYRSEASDLFILGETEDEVWEPFETGRTYKAFLTSRKSYI